MYTRLQERKRSVCVSGTKCGKEKPPIWGERSIAAGKKIAQGFRRKKTSHLEKGDWDD